MKKEIWLVGLVLLSGVFLRTWRISKDLLIHYDQGRDLLAAYNIWHNQDLTLLGPATDVEGIFFGPAYYYLLSIPLALSGGNPVSAILLLQFIEIISWMLLYLSVRKVLGKDVASWVLVISMVSYGLVGYSRWLSNVQPTIALSNLLVYLLVEFSLGKKYFLHLAFLCLGLLWQFNPAVGIGIFFFLVFLRIKNGGLKQWLISIGLFISPGIPQLLFDLRHNFLITRSIIEFLSSSGGPGISVQTIKSTVFQIAMFNSNIFTSGNILLSGVLILFLIFELVTTKRNSRSIYLFLGIAISQIAVLFLFKRGVFEFFYLGITGSLITLVVMVFVKYGRLGRMLLCLLVAMNIYYSVKGFSRPGLNLIPLGSANVVTLEHRLSVVNYLKENVHSSYNWWVYTLPYFQNHVWEYMLVWQGISGPVEEGTELIAIFEPDWVAPYRLKNWYDQLEKETILVADFSAGPFTIQKRAWLSD